MISNFLIQKFIKDSSNFKDKKVRERYGYLGGIVGILVNLMLFAIKFSVGVIVNSIAVTADAFNNLSDVGSSLVTIFGFSFLVNLLIGNIPLAMVELNIYQD